MSDSAISVRGLRKTYRDNVAIDSVDLEVAPGEIFALLGPNGAGKTTTVEILEGYRKRDAGEVRVLLDRLAGREQFLDRARGDRLADSLRAFGEEQTGLVALAAAVQAPGSNDPGRPFGERSYPGSLFVRQLRLPSCRCPRPPRRPWRS